MPYRARADRTTAPRPSRAELERAERAGLGEPPRTALRRQVGTVAASSDSEEASFAGLRPRAGGAAAIQAASDVLHVTADITGNREPAKAADSYDRAAREPYGRLPPVTPYGSALRAVARTLAVTNVRRGDRREHKRNLTVDLLFLIAN